MRLTIGITNLTPAWEILLKQIAPPFERLNPKIGWTPDNYSCIICSGHLDRYSIEKLNQFVKMGGALLSETDAAEQIFNTRSRSHFVDYIDTEGDPIFKAVTSGFIGSRLSIPNGATLTQETHGKKLIEYKTVGRGQILILPGGLVNTILSYAHARRNFPSQGPWLPSERVAKVSKRTVRELVTQALKELFWKRKLPFVSLSPFLDGNNSTFSFRIDTDFASIRDVDSLYNLCVKHEIPATWFVETGSCKPWLHRYGDMTGQDIGLHCFKHRIARKYSDNENDINTGKTLLKSNGISPKGYAAPFGEWHSSLNKALEYHGFEYSSEFSLDYDNLPFWPALNDRFSSMVQIPIHPISIGSLRNARHSNLEMVNYFEDVIKNHLLCQLPIFFYDHPSNTNLEVLDKVFQSIRKKNISKISMGEYVDWWKIRDSLHWSATWQDGRLHLSTKNAVNGVHILISQSEKMCSVALTENELLMNEMNWTSSQSASSQIPHISVRARLNHKMILNDILHTYWKYKL